MGAMPNVEAFPCVRRTSTLVFLARCSKPANGFGGSKGGVASAQLERCSRMESEGGVSGYAGSHRKMNGEKKKKIERERAKCVE